MAIEVQKYFIYQSWIKCYLLLLSDGIVVSSELLILKKKQRKYGYSAIELRTFHKNKDKDNTSYDFMIFQGQARFSTFDR